MDPIGVATHNCTSNYSKIQAIQVAVVGLMKECVALASNKTVVGRVFTINVPDTTACGSPSLHSSAFKQ